MSVAFYADEHVPGPIVKALRGRGVDIITAREDRNDGQPDDFLLRRATELIRLLLSYDLDFFTIAAREQAAGHYFTGIISVPDSMNYRAILDDLEMMAKCTELNEWEFQILHFLKTSAVEIDLA